MRSYLLVLMVSFLVSLGRLYATSQTFITELVWAEDGLFPLCVANYGYWNCLWDPYAGYLLFLSRSVAVPVSLFPLEYWPQATNVVAAFLYGAMSVLLYWLFRRIPLHFAVAGFLAVMPVFLPIVGLEAINATGSAYMMLLVVASVAVSVTFSYPVPTWLISVLLLLSALTIPIAALLAVPIIIRMILRITHVRRGMSFLGFLAVGSVIQFTVIARAAGQRSMNASTDSVVGWIEGLAPATLSLIGLTVELSETGRMVLAGADANFVIGMSIGATLLGVATAALIKGRELWQSAGLLIITGLAMSAVPAILGFDNNRYYVIYTALLLIGLFLFLPDVSSERSSRISIVTCLALIIIWLPSFPANQFRATAAPKWIEMLASLRMQCEADPKPIEVNLTFTPMWPYADLPPSPVTHARIPCERLN